MPKYIMRFEDGPAAEHPPAIVDAFGWPLPEKILFGGVTEVGMLLSPFNNGEHVPQGTTLYRKERESQAPSRVDFTPNFMRGATYRMVASA